MPLEKPSSSHVANAANISLPLSPVFESHGEESSLEEDEQFADALEEHTMTEQADEKKEDSKRDSKIEDDFESIPNFDENKEEPGMENEAVNIENSQAAEPLTTALVTTNATVEKNKTSPMSKEVEEDDEITKPESLSASALFLVVLGLCLAVLLVSLDRTIITTAIPAITNEFKSTSAVGWYGSSYLVTACALQPTYGRMYTLFNVKWTFLHAVALFELGSLICAVAPNSTTLIIGRAIAGWGSAGILTGGFVVIAFAVPLEKRPIYTAAIGVMYGAGAAAGPVLGGVFAGMVTWRWCFYFNLPVGSVTLIVIAFFFKRGSAPLHKTSFIQRMRQVDILGSALVLISFTMLFLALEYNTQGYELSSALVIGLFCGFGVTLLIFVAWQWHRQERALIVPNVLIQRTVAAACLLAFFIYAVLILHGYYLPIWFQAIQGTSTESSGVSMLAYVLPNAIFGLLTGIFITKVGYFAPPAIVGCAITVAGSGLISTLQPATDTVKWAGFICFVAAGVGMAIQQSFTAVQSVLRLDQIPIATAAVTCFQSLGGAVFISIGNSILANELRSASQANELPGVDIGIVLSAGATQFRSTVPADSLPAMIDVYNIALQKVFTAAIPLAGIAFASTLLMEWRNVRIPSHGNSATSLEAANEVPVLPDVDVETRISPITTRLAHGPNSGGNSSRGSSRGTG
ncbi:major facilitator superfamily domain-containing protein [Talaromyces proteolyticus]|uniref:Major facilitator superfamily domain-containing protein n=1 Tax=Talaromyces proteolyticus TaxID=1131652 RepID=A0AAD4KNN4_9EURO|nr:major facilitator superfamily domain-containing protein [Talaromyces proteolyticus]KAH8695529.1 major facilitator superfamily domain-containing protein [Talaromyces proteolyticus]